jgi:hypothetical protein
VKTPLKLGRFAFPHMAPGGRWIGNLSHPRLATLPSGMAEISMLMRFFAIIGMAHDLMNKASSQGAVRATHLDIVWVVRTSDAARPWMHTLKSLIEDVKHTPLAVRLQVCSW